MVDYFNSYGGGNQDIAYNEILEYIDFNNSNLLGYIQEEDTGSRIHAVGITDNINITIYSYTPAIVTDVIADNGAYSKLINNTNYLILIYQLQIWVINNQIILLIIIYIIIGFD